MSKLDLQTPDFVAANAARLAELFPNCVTETKQPDGTLKRTIDFDLLRQELAYDIVEGPQERYRLDWPGKREALALANAPIRKTLRPCKDESVDFDNTQNLYIEGDNLDALKLLQETYLGKVKMIYIDPPYNTGNDFIYDDNFSISGEEHDLLSGTRDEEGNAMFDEEKWKQNSSASGRFHSEWLSMIYPRLKLARNLLREDGVIFLSIGNQEVDGLKQLACEVFGSSNFISIICRVMKTGGAKGQFFTPNIDFVLVFGRNKEVTTPFRTRIEDHQLQTYYKFVEKNGDRKGEIYGEERLYKASLDPRPNQRYWIQCPDGSFAIPPGKNFPKKVADGEKITPTSEDGVWKWTYDRLKEERKKGNLIFKESDQTALVTPDGKQSRYNIYNKLWLSEQQEKGKVPPNYLDKFENRKSSKELEELKIPFEYAKPSEFLSFLIEISRAQPDSIILDFFSGSATTAHAVMQLNAEDGGKRRHIMVQIPEPCEEKSEAFKAGFKTIAEIGKERIRRAGKKILEEWQAKKASSAEHLKLDTENSDASPPDIGFRVLKIDSSNMADVYYQPDEITQDGLMLQVDNLRPGRNPEDLLFQVLLDWGVDLALPITEETILKRRVFFVADNALAACFDTGLDEDFVKELAKRQPLRAVFRDSGYASDAVKINFEQIFKALSPHTELKTL